MIKMRQSNWQPRFKNFIIQNDPYYKFQNKIKYNICIGNTKILKCNCSVIKTISISVILLVKLFVNCLALLRRW